MIWFKNADDFVLLTESWKNLLADLENAVYHHSDKTYTCYCSLCNTVFKSKVRQYTGEWIDLRGEFSCDCGFSARMRMLLSQIVSEAFDKSSNIILFEQVTPFYRKLSSLYPNVVGCEFLGSDKISGNFYSHNNALVMHQDMMNTSFEDGAFDCVVHSDVLEHVPDYIAGLRENFRILRDGGLLMFACPIYNHKDHVVR